MQSKHLYYAVGITTHIVSIIALPIAGKQNLNFTHLHLLSNRNKLVSIDPGLIILKIIAHARERDLEVISVRSPEDMVPVEECKRALTLAPFLVLDKVLCRRCSGEGEGEEEIGADDNGDTSSDDLDDEIYGNTQIASNSPRQDCILTQMELFPMPKYGLCESLPDTPPAPNPAPPVTPGPAPVTPPPAPPPAPQPARKPVPVDADGPARAIPKPAIKDHSLKGVSARSEDPACEEVKRSLDSRSCADIRRRCDGSAGGDDGGEGEGEGGDEGEGEGEGGDGGEGDISDTSSEGSSEGDFSDLDGEQLAALDLPDKWNDERFCYAWIATVGALPDVGCDMFQVSLPPPFSGPPAPTPPARPISPPSTRFSPRNVNGGNTGGGVPRVRRDGPEGPRFEGIGGGIERCGVIKIGSDD